MAHAQVNMQTRQSDNIVYVHTVFKRDSYSGNTLAFQAKARSSILLSRSSITRPRPMVSNLSMMWVTTPGFFYFN